MKKRFRFTMVFEAEVNGRVNGRKMPNKSEINELLKVFVKDEAAVPDLYKLWLLGDLISYRHYGFTSWPPVCTAGVWASTFAARQKWYSSAYVAGCAVPVPTWRWAVRPMLRRGCFIIRPKERQRLMFPAPMPL